MSKQRFKITVRDTETNRDTKIRTEKYIVSFLNDKGVPSALYLFDKTENPLAMVTLGLYTFVSTSLTILLGDFIRNTVMGIFEEMKKKAAGIVQARVMPSGIQGIGAGGVIKGVKIP